MPQLNARSLRLAITVDAVGGVWRYAVDAGRELARRGAEVVLVGAGPAPSAGQREDAAAASLDLHWLAAELDWMAADRDAACRAAAMLDAALGRIAPTLLHLNSPALKAALDGRFPTVAAAHSCLPTWWLAVRRKPLPAEWRWYAAMMADGLAQAEAVVVPTAAFGRALETAYGPMAHLRTVWNGVHPIAPAAKRPYAMAVGRWWDDGKNGRVLDAGARLAATPVRAAGALDGPNGTAFRFAAAEALGELPHAALRAELARARIFIAPSLYEPFGLAVAEAASAGAALLLADIAGFRELWDGAARFFDPEDPANLAQALDRLAADPAGAAAFGEAARRRAGRYGLAAQADGLLEAYAAALAPAVRAA